ETLHNVLGIGRKAEVERVIGTSHRTQDLSIKDFFRAPLNLADYVPAPPSWAKAGSKSNMSVPRMPKPRAATRQPATAWATSFQIARACAAFSLKYGAALISMSRLSMTPVPSVSQVLLSRRSPGIGFRSKAGDRRQPRWRASYRKPVLRRWSSVLQIRKLKTSRRHSSWMSAIGWAPN